MFYRIGEDPLLEERRRGFLLKASGATLAYVALAYATLALLDEQTAMAPVLLLLSYAWSVSLLLLIYE